ncbi:hypothetical protein HMI54_012778 [Coelomomyces lativittatus]|nr:hypothetical protein HMI56_006283 [Coelomomyces lativittatus]KAJ1515171.1 hypothetical protein HMI54_012778 [Coelomomyces lativittatus]KAJ1515378.1 hypothetical protein HMI55_003754 [Coelomomyces lativittatus]
MKPTPPPSSLVTTTTPTCLSQNKTSLDVSLPTTTTTHAKDPPDSFSSSEPKVCPPTPGSTHSSNGLVPPPDYQPRRFLYFLYLHPHFSGLHFFMYLLACFFTISFFVFMGSMTTSVVYFITEYEGEVSQAIGALGTYDEIISIPSVLLWGFLSDRIGRHWVYSSGFIIMGIAFFVYPFAKNVYPQLLLARLFFAIGAGACSAMLTAVLGDCAGRLRGRIAGLVGIFNCLGGVFSAFFFLRLPTWFSKGVSNVKSIQYTFFVPGSLATLFGISYFFLSESKPRPSSSHMSTSSKLSPIQEFKAGFVMAKDIRMLVAYASGLVARANTIVLTNFIPLWVTAYAIDSGMCTLDDYSDKLDVKKRCEWAYKQFSSLTGVTYVILLLGSPFWGYLSDRYGITEALSFRTSRFQSPTFPIFVSCLVSTLGYGLLCTQRTPDGWVVYLICSVIGFGAIGTIVTSATMISANFIDPKLRGYVSGVYSFFGAIGIMICSSMGGLLFKYWYLAPFALVGTLHIFVALLCIIAMIYGPPLPPYHSSLKSPGSFSFFRKKDSAAINEQLSP